MLLATHSIVAATAGEAIGNPILAFCLGFVIHFLLDAIPHYDTTDDGKFTTRQIVLAGIDGLIGLSVLVWLFLNRSYSPYGLLFGAAGGIAPDVLLNIPVISRVVTQTFVGRRVHAFHIKIQQSIILKPLPGLAIQYIISSLALFILLRFVI